MKIFNTQAEVDAALDANGNLRLMSDVQFNCDVKIDGVINAKNIKARNIKAWDIDAWNIKAQNINYYAFCLAYESFKCQTPARHAQ